MALYEFDGKRPLVPDDSFVHPQAALIGDIEIGHDRFELGGDHHLRHHADLGHLAGILGGQRGDNRCPPDPYSRKSLQVGLDTGAAAAVRTGNGENAHIARRGWNRNQGRCHGKNYGLCARSKQHPTPLCCNFAQDETGVSPPVGVD